MSIKNMIIEFTNEYLAKYPNINPTIRQIYYQLVANQKIENKKNSYKYVSKSLTEARYRAIQGIEDNLSVNWERITDSGRTVITSTVAHYPIKFEIRYKIKELLNSNYYLDRMLYQPEVVVILLEKNALENIFEPVVRQLDSYLLVGRGYSSFTALAKLSQQLNKENRKIHVKIFTDYDSSGLDIQRYMKDAMIDRFSVKFESIERIALTEEQVLHYNLPIDVLKSSDSRTKSTEAKFAVELDALNPPILTELIRQSILKHFNNKIYKEVEKLEAVNQRQYKKRLVKAMKKATEYL